MRARVGEKDEERKVSCSISLAVLPAHTKSNKKRHRAPKAAIQKPNESWIPRAAPGGGRDVERRNESASVTTVTCSKAKNSRVRVQCALVPPFLECGGFVSRMHQLPGTRFWAITYRPILHRTVGSSSVSLARISSCFGNRPHPSTLESSSIKVPDESLTLPYTCLNRVRGLKLSTKCQCLCLCALILLSKHMRKAAMKSQVNSDWN